MDFDSQVRDGFASIFWHDIWPRSNTHRCRPTMQTMWLTPNSCSYSTWFFLSKFLFLFMCVSDIYFVWGKKFRDIAKQHCVYYGLVYDAYVVYTCVLYVYMHHDVCFDSIAGGCMHAFDGMAGNVYVHLKFENSHELQIGRGIQIDLITNRN